MMTIMLLLVTLLLMTWFTENGDFGWSLLVLIACGATIYFLDKSLITTNLWGYIVNHNGYIIAGSILYLFIGIGWSLLKWKWFAEEHYKENTHELRLYGNKERITGWMMWWPMSLGWFLLHDPITRFYNYIYNKLTKTFQSIADSAKSKYTKEGT